MSRVRLVPIIFVVICSLAILYGGFLAYRQYNLVGPVEAKVQSIAGVKSAQVVSGTPSQVTVQLGNVADLQSTYDEIVSTVNNSLGTGVSLKLKDKPSPALLMALEDIYPSIIDNRAKSNYSVMGSTAQAIAARDGVHARVTMDSNSIYIQLWQGKGSSSYYMYRVIPLQP